MKTFKLLLGAFILLSFSSCNKKNNSVNNVNFAEIVGTYQGSLFNNLTNITTDSVYAEITKAGDELIQIHCFGGGFDTTYMLNVYDNGDYTMVCMNGNAFQNQYGHACNSSNMMNKSGSTAWDNHMAANHISSDVHFGSFNMKNHSFNYDFTMKDNLNNYSIKYNGVRN